MGGTHWPAAARSKATRSEALSFLATVMVVCKVGLLGCWGDEVGGRCGVGEMRGGSGGVLWTFFCTRWDETSVEIGITIGKLQMSIQDQSLTHASRCTRLHSFPVPITLPHEHQLPRAPVLSIQPGLSAPDLAHPGLVVR